MSDMFSGRRKIPAIPPDRVRFDRKTFREFIDYLKELRGGVTHKNLTNQEIAREIGVSRSLIWQYYNGRGNYTPYDVTSISKDVIAALENLWTQYEIDAYEANQQQAGAVEEMRDEYAERVSVTTKRTHVLSEKEKAQHAEKVALSKRVKNSYKWNFNTEWFYLSYNEAIGVVLEAYKSAYVQGAMELNGYVVAKSARMARIDRKIFRRLFDKHDGKPIEAVFSEEDLATPYKVLREAIVNDFRRQYLVHALERAQGNISRAAREVSLDRKYFERRLKQILLEDPNDPAS